jgi:hypothetical protein
MINFKYLTLLAVVCFFSTDAITYNIISDSNGCNVKMRNVISLGKSLDIKKEYVGPIFKIRVDSLVCSKKNFDLFEVICNEKVIGYIVFGKQISSVDPQLELPQKPSDDFEVSLVQEGACGDFKLLLEPKLKSALSSAKLMKK